MNELYFLCYLSGVKVASTDAKTTDLRLAMFTAIHSTVKSIDHLSELLQVLGKGTRLEKIRLHRTKCSKLIANVLAPAQLDDLVEDVRSCKSAYSLIVDEGTDQSMNKFLGACIR